MKFHRKYETRTSRTYVEAAKMSELADGNFACSYFTSWIDQ
jgi:hypothetical protein